MRHVGNKFDRRLAGRRRRWRLWLATRRAFGAGAWVHRDGRIRRYSCCSAATRRALNRCTRRRLSCVPGEELGRVRPGLYRRLTDYWNTIL